MQRAASAGGTLAYSISRPGCVNMMQRTAATGKRAGRNGEIAIICG
jgi:hypothetical protein